MRFSTLNSSNFAPAFVFIFVTLINSTPLFNSAHFFGNFSTSFLSNCRCPISQYHIVRPQPIQFTDVLRGACPCGSGQKFFTCDPAATKTSKVEHSLVKRLNSPYLEVYRPQFEVCNKILQTENSLQVWGNPEAYVRLCEYYCSLAWITRAILY